VQTGDARRTAAAPRVRAAGATDPGLVRSGNEDRLHVDADRGIFVVVDGVGGHAAGEVAAAIAVDIIVQRLERPLWSPERRVREAIALANNEILAQAQAAPERTGMTCVLTLALLTDGGMTIGHVGDTRLYTLSASGIAKLTHDHSPVGEREDAQEITELEAMRHPRRNEVFRDVGSAFRQPDEPGFVDVLEAPFDERSALLLCSDGLSDMIPSSAIDRIVRAHAGDPAAVVDALIRAANEAGGKDNVTAVYVEGALFADASARAAASPQSAAHGHGHALPVLPAMPVTGGARVSSLPHSRLTWLCVGALVGLAGGLGLAWTLSLDAPLPRRPLVVGPAPDQIATIAEAMTAAIPGDVVLVEPGEYAEEVVLADGVDLEARIPGTVTLVAPSHSPDWVSVQASGRLGNRIRGIRVRGRPDAPVATGLRLTGHALDVSDVTIEGAVTLGIHIVQDGDIMIGASRFQDVEGTPLRIGTAAQPTIRENLFLYGAGTSAPAIDVAADAAPVLQGNVFVGYAHLLTPSDREGHGLPDGNLSIERPARSPVTGGRGQ
jgi:serine/threonine protein phosphatase PrpC